LYRFVLQTVLFRVFSLGYVSDRANFTNTTIEAYKKNFEQKIWSNVALERRETGFITLREWRASDFVYQQELVLLLSNMSSTRLSQSPFWNTDFSSLLRAFFTDLHFGRRLAGV
jgi:hypothetical protein